MYFTTIKIFLKIVYSKRKAWRHEPEAKTPERMEYTGLWGRNPKFKTAVKAT